MKLNTFGKRLTLIRKKAFLTQAQLANKINCIQSEIALYEKDKRYPSKEKMEKIISILNVDPQWLIYGESGTYEINETDLGQQIKLWHLKRNGKTIEKKDICDRVKKLNDEQIQLLDEMLTIVESSVH